MKKIEPPKRFERHNRSLVQGISEKEKKERKESVEALKKYHSDIVGDTVWCRTSCGGIFELEKEDVILVAIIDEDVEWMVVCPDCCELIRFGPPET